MAVIFVPLLLPLVVDIVDVLKGKGLVGDEAADIRLLQTP